MVVVAAGIWFGVRRCTRLEVLGDSMRPSFEPGDRVLVLRTRRFGIGDVVAVPDPRDSRRLLVKRVHEVSGETVELRGDHDSASTDSRTFGPVARSAVAGRVLYRYAPPGRVTWRP